MEIGELQTASVRDAASRTLLERVEKAYQGKVTDIYFTQFVTQ
jgi:flagellar basal body-associated protein FliL